MVVPIPYFGQAQSPGTGSGTVTCYDFTGGEVPFEEIDEPARKWSDCSDSGHHPNTGPLFSATAGVYTDFIGKMFEFPGQF